MHLADGRRTLRNSRLLVESAWQHLRDDPALLVIQVSRRMPLTVRSRAGRAMQHLGSILGRADGLAALGAVMAGDERTASHLARRSAASGSRLGGEVAVLLDQSELVDESAPPALRARAAMSIGDVSGAIAVLEAAGRGRLAQAARLRSERRLMTPGHRLRGTRRSATTPEGPVEPSPPERRAGERLRVLHFLTNSLPHTQSGYSLRTHRVLLALRETGVDSMALTRTGYPVMVGKVRAADADLVDGITYRRCIPAHLAGTPEERLVQEIAEAMEVVRRYRPHLLHATTDYRNALVARAVSEATGIPWVLEVRGLMEQTWIASHRTSRTRALAEGSERARLVAAREAELVRRADAVVTLSATMADELVARGVEPSDITLVPNGVDPGLLAEVHSAEEARERLHVALPVDAIVVGGVSALVPYEGHEDLLQAVARMIRDDEVPADVRDRIHVVLAGDGTSAPGLVTLASELGIADRVHMPGRVARQDAPWWVQALDIVVVPRRDVRVARSVTPQKPVEAMALGRPVVVSDLPALRETVTDTSGQICAALVPPGDPAALARELLALAGDPGSRVELVRRGSALARERTWPMMMRRYDAVYDRARRRAGEGAADDAR